MPVIWAPVYRSSQPRALTIVSPCRVGDDRSIKDRSIKGNITCVTTSVRVSECVCVGEEVYVRTSHTVLHRP